MRLLVGDRRALEEDVRGELWRGAARGHTLGPRLRGPGHDVLAAGFPCQPFSAAGASKRRSMGAPDGFGDADQGLLFFEILRMLGKKRPAALLLENVKGLASHGGGSTPAATLAALRGAGYATFHRVIDASPLVPQRRERLFVVGFRGAAGLEFPDISGPRPALRTTLSARPAPRYTLADGTWAALGRHAARSRRRGSGFGHTVADPAGHARALSARYRKDGSETLVPQRNGQNPRRLTPRGCVRLMGFPAGFALPVSDSRAYRQLGNAVVPAVVSRVAAAMARAMGRAPARHGRAAPLRAHATAGRVRRPG